MIRRGTGKCIHAVFWWWTFDHRNIIQAIGTNTTSTRLRSWISDHRNLASKQQWWGWKGGRRWYGGWRWIPWRGLWRRWYHEKRDEKRRKKAEDREKLHDTRLSWILCEKLVLDVYNSSRRFLEEERKESHILVRHGPFIVPFSTHVPRSCVLRSGPFYSLADTCGGWKREDVRNRVRYQFSHTLDPTLFPLSSLDSFTIRIMRTKVQ